MKFKNLKEAAIYTLDKYRYYNFRVLADYRVTKKIIENIPTEKKEYNDGWIMGMPYIFNINGKHIDNQNGFIKKITESNIHPGILFPELIEGKDPSEIYNITRGVSNYNIPNIRRFLDKFEEYFQKLLSKTPNVVQYTTKLRTTKDKVYNGNFAFYAAYQIFYLEEEEIIQAKIKKYTKQDIEDMFNVWVEENSIFWEPFEYMYKTKYGGLNTKKIETFAFPTKEVRAFLDKKLAPEKVCEAIYLHRKRIIAKKINQDVKLPEFLLKGKEYLKKMTLS